MSTAVILLVDDDSDQLALFEAMLRAWGYNVIAASSAAEALAGVQQQDIDVVVCDLCMPHVGGRELIAALRRAERTAQVPVIGITALDPALDGSLGDWAVDAFIEKQEAGRKLREAIEQLRRR